MKIIPLSTRYVRIRLRNAAAAFSAAKAEYERVVELMQKRCPHRWEWEGDPTGGTDSGYCCGVCGLWRKRIDESPLEVAE